MTSCYWYNGPWTNVNLLYWYNGPWTIIICYIGTMVHRQCLPVILVQLCMDNVDLLYWYNGPWTNVNLLYCYNGPPTMTICYIGTTIDVTLEQWSMEECQPAILVQWCMDHNRCYIGTMVHGECQPILVQWSMKNDHPLYWDIGAKPMFTTIISEQWSMDKCQPAILVQWSMDNNHLLHWYNGP